MMSSANFPQKASRAWAQAVNAIIDAFVSSTMARPGFPGTAAIRCNVAECSLSMAISAQYSQNGADILTVRAPKASSDLIDVAAITASSDSSLIISALQISSASAQP